MTFDDVLAKFQGVKRRGANAAMALCPAHPDTKPSLSIRQADDGTILLKCHSGNGCDAQKIVKAVGIELRDLFPPKGSKSTRRGASRPSRKAPRGKIVATYDYKDAEGKLLYQVVKYESKDFSFRRPDGKGGWFWNLQDTPRILYRLSELNDHDPLDWIFICEGEKDCDAVFKIGGLATCNSGGAGKWGLLSDDSILAGRRVCIVADKDGPGRAHAADVEKRLQGKAAVVKVIELPGQAVKDVSDWIGANEGKARADLLAELEAFADNADVWVPDADGAEVEGALLGALLGGESLDACRAEGVTSDSFEDRRNATVYTAIEITADAGVAIDHLTVSETLRNRGEFDKAGGAAYLSALADGVPAADHAAHYARIIRERARKRQLDSIGRELTQASQNGQSADEIIEATRKRLDEIGISWTRSGPVPASAAVQDISLDGEPEGARFSTRLRALDGLLGGVYLGELLCVGGYSGHGKTGFGGHIARAALSNDPPISTAIFSLEMPRRAVLARMVCTDAGVSYSRMRRGQLSEQERVRVEAARQRVAGSPLFIRDGSASIGQIVSEARSLIDRDGVRLVVVDYVQLIGSDAADRRLQVEEVAQRLLGLAVETGAAVLALSQLRKRQEGHGQRPSMHDLRESSALFEAPHVVLLLNRPHLGAWERCDECGGDGPSWCPGCDGRGGHSLDTTCEIIIEKNRNGECGLVEVAWRGETMHFADLEHAQCM